MKSIQFGNTTIAYTLKESTQRKTLSISVGRDGVEVVSPFNTPLTKIEDVLYKKGPWIVEQMSEFKEMYESPRIKAFVSGEKLPYLGRQYRLKVTHSESDAPSLRFEKGQFYAEVPRGTPQEAYRETLKPLYIEWVKRKALLFAKQRTKPFEGKLQKSPKEILIKDQEQRWGSCTPDGKVLLNWRLFLAPASIVDYVIAHELAHLVYMNHFKEYWDLVRMLLPDYENRKEWLRLKGASLDV
ncbi:M48 family metallopeptidase [Rossellomorea marisflavi]|uniref:M48 family metallopeptidase n=1 Tax=Rossellomorea marisflavi TaxID=189381 RepID=UPI003459BB8B